MADDFSVLGKKKLEPILACAMDALLTATETLSNLPFAETNEQLALSWGITMLHRHFLEILLLKLWLTISKLSPKNVIILAP